MKKQNKKKDKPCCQKLKSLIENRFIIYAVLLIGGITLDIGVLIVNSSWKVLSISMIVVGSVLVLFALKMMIDGNLE